MLVAWTEFLKNPESEKVRSLEMTIEEIRRAKDQLVRMSNDSEQRAIYEMRAKILKDKVSALNKAKEEGREQGKIEVAKNLLSMGMDTLTVIKVTGLSKEDIEKIKP
jgi:predicted transposase/invertase (TIGR01784 family)